METETSNGKHTNKVAFIEYSSSEPGQHFMTVMAYVNHKRVIIGRVFKEYDGENKRIIYRAKDNHGVPVFPNIVGLTALKQEFITNCQSLAKVLPKNQSQQKNSELPEKENRDSDLKQIRDQKADKQQERKPQR